MQKIRYSPDEEMTLMAKLWNPAIADDPLNFVMFTFPWGQAGTPLEAFDGPRKWQREALNKLGEHIRENRGQLEMSALRKAVASGRGVGKSALVAWLILWMLSTRIGSTVIVSANTESQLRSITWGELTKWVTLSFNSHWWEVSATKVVPAQWLVDAVERDLKKGTRYWAAEGKLWSEENPDGYAGAHNMSGMMLIFDEASGIPDSIWSVAAGFFTENILDRYWFAFSNGRNNSGYFFECFHSKREIWDTNQIDAREVEGTDKSIYQGIISEYGADSREARVEVYGQFPSQGDDQFISPQLVADAMDRLRHNDPGAPIVIGVDPARGGADSTVIAVRRGRDLIAMYRYHGDDTMTVVGHVITAIELWVPQLTVVDEGGLGSGVLDRLKEQNFKVRGVNFGWKSSKPAMWGNKRAEIWGLMREWLRVGHLPTDKRLKQDLVGPTQKPNSSGVIFLETKEAMKKRGLASPDAGDALAITFAYPVYNRNSQIDRVVSPVYANEGSSALSWMGG